MTYVAARALAQGRRAGIISALGIGVGCFFHIGAAALGIAVLLQTVPQAYAIVRIAGAAYLIYLGLGLMRRAGRESAAAPLDKTSEWRMFRQGVITNVLNPKVALFFLAFLPQFVDPAGGPVGLQTLALGIFFDVQGTTVNIIVACVAAAAGRALESVRRSGWMDRVSGAILLALGVRLAFARSG
jgi:threonine/homoserine/homoserine lactone efflux protein